MADVKWIKITTDIFDDEKILMIESMPSADSIIVIWFKLLAFAGKQNNNGVFLMSNRIAYTDEMLASIFRRDVKIVRLALDTFEMFGMIERINNAITIPNWEKHQSLDKFEIAREKTRQRVAKHREKQKLLAEGNATCNVTVTESNADRIDKDKDIDLDFIDKIDIIDKIDKSDFSPLDKPNSLTKNLIEAEYIEEDDLCIKEYNDIFEELIKEYSFEIVRSCLWYFIKRYKQFPEDEDGNEIENKVAYFRAAMVNGAQRLERDNNKKHCGVGSWLYN